MSKHPSVIKGTGDCLHALTAYGAGKHAAKLAVRKAAVLAGEHPAWSVSSGRIHAEKTEQEYWRVVQEYVAWARAEHGVSWLEDLDARADELASAYVQARWPMGKQMARPTARGACTCTAQPGG